MEDLESESLNLLKSNLADFKPSYEIQYSITNMLLDSTPFIFHYHILILFLLLLTIVPLTFSKKIRNSLTKWFQNVVLKTIKLGPIPKHIAFIMDGNRRFAKTSGMKTAEGHLAGFSTLEDTLNWSLKLGVKCVTVYAFSVENFKRPQEEVDNLMELAEEKFNAFAHNSDFIKKNEISVRVLGELELLPPKIRKAAINVTKSTSHHKNAIFNICFPYTSFLEIEDAALEIINGIKSNDINKDDVSEEFFNKLLYTGDCPPVDILIRTSGEIRFSDFLLWQCSDKCSVHFLDCYWPDFSFWDMLPIILQFQALFTPLKEESNPLPNAKITEFLEKIRLKKRLQGEELH